MSEMSCDEYPVRTEKFIFEFMINTASPASNNVYRQNFTRKKNINIKIFPINIIRGSVA